MPIWYHEHMSGQYFEVESRRSHLTIDGIVLEFYDFGGCGSALLLVHGLAGGAHEWRATAKLLVSSHRVLAFDQRGHGFSSKPSGNYSRDAYVGDVIQVIEQLSLAPLVLIGQSMGGLNAMLVAARRPDLVRGLIMIEATPDRDPTVIGDIQVWLNKWPERFQTQEEALAFFGGSSPSSRADPSPRGRGTNCTPRCRVSAGGSTGRTTGPRASNTSSAA